MPSKVNWDLLERRIASSEKAYQRQIIRRKIDELEIEIIDYCKRPDFTVDGLLKVRQAVNARWPKPRG